MKPLLSTCPPSVLSVSQFSSILVHLSSQHVIMYILPNQSGTVLLRILLNCWWTHILIGTMLGWHTYQNNVILIFPIFSVAIFDIPLLICSKMTLICFGFLSSVDVLLCVCVCVHCKQRRAPVKSTGLPAQSSPLPSSSDSHRPRTAHTKHTCRTL